MEGSCFLVNWSTARKCLRKPSEKQGKLIRIAHIMDEV